MRFKKYVVESRKQITEALKMSDFPKAAALIRTYMQKHLKQHVFFFPQPEVFTSRGVSQVGIKFFMGSKAFRLNWQKNKISTAAGLTSMDYWDGSKIPQPNPSHHIQFDHDQSLASVLPFIRDYLLGDVKETDGIYVAEQSLPNGGVLLEAAYSESTLKKTAANMLKAFSDDIQLRQQYLNGGNRKYGQGWNELQKAIREVYPELFAKRPGNKALIMEPHLVSKVSVDKLVASVTGEEGVVKYKVTPGTTEIVEVDGVSDEDVDRMTYEEQLDALKTGMRLLMSNATNALFLGGRGGTGKTQTVEDMLHGAGLDDGDGYFKITGSATPVGIYRILFEHRKEIILFDDSDTALIDQEGRNLFKAASDTRKVRKISWMKGGKNFVDPDSYDEEDPEEGTLPRSFEFTGKIIFISNLPLNKLDPDGALRTRGYVINVDPTNEEIYDFMNKIVDKIPLDVDYKLTSAQRREVVDVLKSRKIANKTANLRSLVRGLNTRAGVEQQGGSAEEWRKFVKMFA